MKEITELLKKEGIKLNKLQLRSYKKIVNGKNLLIIAPTGYGKTLASVLPTFEIIKKSEGEGIKALYIAPLKALDRDVFKRISKLGNKLGINVEIRHGDTPKEVRKLQSEEKVDMLIITPEMLNALLIGKKIRKKLRSVKVVIIDEIHELINDLRGLQLSLLLKRLSLISNFQVIGLSATLFSEEAKFYFGKMEEERATEKKKYDVEVILASNLISKIIEKLSLYKKVLIFTNTRETCEELGSILKDYNVKVHHSSLSKEVRIEVEKEFREGKIKGIIATSSLELGIDIGDIDYVIQVNSPRQVKKLKQRIGRGNHKIGEISKGCIICDNIFDYYESKAIVNLIDRFIEKEKVPFGNYSVLLHQLIGLILEYGQVDVNFFYKFIKSCYAYKNFTFEDLKKLLKFGEEINLIYKVGNLIRKKRRAIKYYYDNLSTIPSVKEYLVIDKMKNKCIGKLSESFVSFLNEGSKFSIASTCYEVIEIKENKVFVTESEDFFYSIPYWEGELIDVSKKVSNLVRKFFEEKYKIKISNFIIEEEKGYTVLHSFNGSMINRALSILLKGILSQYKEVNVLFDPYKVYIIGANKEEVANAIETLKSSDIDRLFDLFIKNEKEFLNYLFITSKRFGITKDSFNIRFLVRTLYGTIAWEEAKKEFLRKKVDLEGVKEILKKSLVEFRKTKFGKMKRERKREKEIERVIELAKESKVYVICLNCLNTLGLMKVKNVSDNLKCSKCKSKFLTFIPEREAIKGIKIVKKLKSNLKLSEEEKAFFNKMEKIADMYMSYGNKIILLLNIYGIGIRTAERILSHYTDIKEGIREEVKKFLRTKKYWK